MIRIKNNEQEIVETNYWESTYNLQDKFFLSTNAGCFRLLIPESYESSIEEMKTGKEIIITRGYWHEMNKKDAMEVMFDDHSESPFVLFLSPGQLDRHPTSEDIGKKVKFLAYKKGLVKVLDDFCYYRIAKTLPCLLPWQ